MLVETAVPDARVPCVSQFTPLTYEFVNSYVPTDFDPHTNSNTTATLLGTSYYLLDTRGDQAATRYGAYLITGDLKVGSGNVDLVYLQNTTSVDATPLFLNLVDSALLKVLWADDADKAGISVGSRARQRQKWRAGVLINLFVCVCVCGFLVSHNQVSNYPLPLTQLEHDLRKRIGALFAAIIIVFFMAFIPAAFIVFIVRVRHAVVLAVFPVLAFPWWTWWYVLIWSPCFAHTQEREVAAKHQQLISGVSIPAYWFSSLAYDSLTYVLPAGIALAIIKGFEISQFVDVRCAPPPVILPSSAAWLRGGRVWCTCPSLPALEVSRFVVVCCVFLRARMAPLWRRSSCLRCTVPRQPPSCT